MKTISILFLLCIIPFITIAHEEPSKTLHEKKEKENQRQKILNAGIKKSTAWKYVAIDGKMAQNGAKVIVQEYDKSGNLFAVEAYNNDSLSLRVEYTFDENNNMLSDIDYSPDKKMIEKNLYKFDKEGRVISGEFYIGDTQTTESFILEKGENKKSISFIKYKDKDSLDYRLEYTYSFDYDKSDYVEANQYDSEGNLMLRVLKKYNADDLKIEKAIYDADQKLTYTFRYEYDNNGNLSKMSKEKSTGELEWCDIYSYDKNYNCTELKSYSANGTLETIIKYTYEYY